MAVGGVVCSVVGGVVILKDSVGGGQYDKEAKQDDTPAGKKSYKETCKDKVYVVTGANSGIGKEIVTDLAHRGAKVYMACRDMLKCEEVRRDVVIDSKNKYVYCRMCDLASLDSVRSFVSEFRAKEDRLDGLVNNAGVMNSPRAFSKDGVEIHFAVNHLGHFLLTSLLTDVLKSSAPSRVVYLMNLDYRSGEIRFDDINGTEKYNQSDAFYQSQLANMMAVKSFSELLKDSKVTVNAAYPGVSSTNIKRHMGVDKSITGYFISRPLLWFLSRSAERGSQTPLYVCLSEALSGETGKLYSGLKEIEIDPKAEDALVAKRLAAVDKYWAGLVKSKDELIGEMAVKNKSQ